MQTLNNFLKSLHQATLCSAIPALKRMPHVPRVDLRAASPMVALAPPITRARMMTTVRLCASKPTTSRRAFDLWWQASSSTSHLQGLSTVHCCSQSCASDPESMWSYVPDCCQKWSKQHFVQGVLKHCKNQGKVRKSMFHFFQISIFYYFSLILHFCSILWGWCFTSGGWPT